MTQDQWSAVDSYIVDSYINDLLIPADAILDATLQSIQDADLPLINAAPNQGRLLRILAQSINARAILEIGTLAVYSTIWLARSLPTDGKLITLEANPKHAAVAQ
jgi:predicted O-methyltransferase YrrM